MALVVEFHEELELDLADREVDLLDLWRGRLSFRRLELLIRDLPVDARLNRAIFPDAAVVASWGSQEHLLAFLGDLIGHANFKNYEPIQRPEQALETQRRAASRSEALMAQRDRQRRREIERRRGRRASVSGD